MPVPRRAPWDPANQLGAYASGFPSSHARELLAVANGSKEGGLYGVLNLLRAQMEVIIASRWAFRS